MSIVQFVRILWARRLIVLAAMVSCMIGAFVVTRLLPPRWEATSRVMLNVMKPDPVTGEIIAGAGLRSYVSTQIELVKDYSVAGQVVDQLGWLSDPGMIARYQKRKASDTRDFRRWLAQIIMDNTKPKLVNDSNILEINYDSDTQDNAKGIADAIRQAYIDSSLMLRRNEATRNAAWFSDETEKLKGQLDAAEDALTQYEKQSGVYIGDDKTDLDTARLRAMAAEGAAAAPIQIAPPTVLPAETELAAVNAEIAQASQTLGPNHPEIQALRAKRTLLTGELASERAAASRGIGPGGQANLDRAVEAQKSRVLAQSDKIERLRQLQTEVNLRRDQFDKASARAADYMQQEGVADTGIVPLGSAVTPQKPVFPNMPLIMIGSVGLGLGMGVFSALLVELLGRRVRGVEDLRSLEEAPLLAVIPGPTRPGASIAPLKMLRRLEWRPGRKVVQA
jgi:uncharacterized protein involved in exopolysaccharide biosynthesis